MDDLLKILGGAGTVGAIWAVLTWLGKMGYIKGRVTIGNDTNGTNGNGNGHKTDELTDYKMQKLEENFAKLAETANHNFTELKESFKEHTADDREFFKEQREFNRDLWERIVSKK